MARTAKLNLLLDADPSGFKQAVDKAVGGELKNVKVNVDAQLNGAGDSFGRSAVAQISRATVKANFGNFVADQLANRIAKATGSAVEEAVRKGTKGVPFSAVTGLIGKAVSIPVEAIAGAAKATLGAISNGATATARTAFQGVVFGVTQSASAELGQGINAGLQKALGGSIGSPELIGRKIIETFGKTITDAALEEGIDLPGIGKEVKRALGEREVLTDSRAKSAQDRQVTRQREEAAQVELNRERQEAARIQSEAIESYSRIAQSVEKQSKAFLEKNRDTVRALRTQLAEAAAQGDSGKDLADSLQRQLNKLLTPLVELEQVQKEAKTKLDQQFGERAESRENLSIVEGGDSYRTVLQKRAEILNKRQLDFVNRIQALQQTLGKGIKAEQALSLKIEKAPDDDKPELLALQEEAKVSIDAIASQINSLKKTRTEITGEIEALAQQAKTLPKGPNKVVVDILKDLGFGNIDPENIPQIQLATNATLSAGSRADYVPEANLIRVRQELFDQLQAAQSTNDLTDEADRRTIREEIAHSAQFAFGSAEGTRAFADRRAINQVSDPTAEEIQRLGPELQNYVRSGRARDAQVELEAKIAADRLAEKNRSIEQQAKDLTELEQTFGYAGVTVQKLLSKTLEGDRPKIAALKTQAQVLGEEAIAQVRALEGLIDQLETSTRQALLQVAEAKTGKAPQVNVAQQKKLLEGNVRQLFGLSEQVDATNQRVKEIAQRPPEPTKQAGQIAVVSTQVSDLGGIVERVGSVLSPIGAIADGTITAFTAVGKAGLALADSLGFAAASLIPGGALAYGPAKGAAKFAAPAVAAGALATQIPGGVELIGAISSAVTAILAPATTGLSSTVGHAVSSEIAGALPSLFSALSRAVAESGLPGAEITASAVDKLGGGLIHLLAPVIRGVAHTADSSIVAVGQAVNEFLGQVGGLLVAGKGLQEGTKLAFDPRAREMALEGIETVGAGIGQVVHGVQDGIQDAQDAIARTSRAVQKNIDGVKVAAEKVGQGNIRAVVDAVGETQSAISNVTRGVQDVAKSSSEAVRDVVEGTGKVAGILRSVVLPDGLDLADLAKDQLIRVSTQLRQKLENTIRAEAQGLPVIGGSATVRQDLELVGRVLEAKYEVVIDNAREETQKQIQAIATPSFEELVSGIDEAIAKTDDEIKRIYTYFSEVVAATKKAVKKGDSTEIARNATEARRVAILLSTQIAELQAEIAQSMPILEHAGIGIGPSTAIGERIRQTKSALGQKAKLIPEKIASLPPVSPDSLASLDISLDEVEDVLRAGASSLSNALKKLIDTVFEVQGDTLKQSLALASQSPRGKDLAVNAAGLAASVAAGSQGPVAGVAADLVGALTARQALGGGGTETFGDITGFLAGNATNAITGVAGSGAIAASVIVPQLQKLKDQIQAKYGAPLEIEVPIELQLDSLQDLGPEVNKARQQVDQIDVLLNELRRLEAEGELLPPNLGERIKEFFQSIANAFSKTDTGEISSTIARIETELARAGETVNTQLQEEIEQVEKDSAALQKTFDEALVRLERTLNAFDRAEEQIDDRADRTIGDIPTPSPVGPEKTLDPNDLNQYLAKKVTVNPTDEERGLVARQRLERDASDRQINDTLRRGKAPAGSADEFQADGDLAIASFEKNFERFNTAADQVENGSTKTQQALRKANETFSSFRQKIEENGGVWGSINRVGNSLSIVAEKAGLPVGAIGKLGGIIKGVGIAALAYIGITQLGDAFVELGRRAFEVSTRVETLQTQLKFVGGESNLPENLEFIRKESERLKRPLDQVTEGFTQLSIATRDTSLEGRTQEIASVIGTLGRVYGLSNENVKSIQYQLGQTIRLGRAQGDELRSLSDAGVNVQGALGKVLGKSAADVNKQLEAGQISAVAVVDALKLLSDTAEKGLPEALGTSQASLDDLNRKFVDLAVLAGEKLKPAVVGGIGVVGQALDFVVANAGKASPIFSAIGEALGLVLDVATPVASAIAAVGGAIANDLAEGAVTPFKIIAAGLREVRNAFDVVGNAANQALGAISSTLPAGLGEILKHANPATIAIQALGFAIGISLTTSIVKSSIAITGTMVKALIGLATTVWTTVIPSIAAARVAALAFIATPLGATITAIAVAAAIAAPHIDEMALAYIGMGKAAYEANERAINFNSKYVKGLNELQKGVPLTAEKIKELKDGFIQNAKEGKDSAKTAEILSANLDRLQANAQAAAKIQGELADAMKRSTEAIKNQSEAIDSEYNERLAGLNEALAGQQITRERFDAAELEAQDAKVSKYSELYKTQGGALRTALSRAQSQLLQPIPDAVRGEVVKQVVELEAQINDIEGESSEQRIGIAQNRVKRLENIEKDRAQRAENEVKALENQLASGVGSELEIEQKISANKQSETNRRIKEIARQLSTEVSSTGKFSEIAKNLYSERAVLETELTKTVSEAATKRYEILLKDLEKTRDKLAGTIAEAEVEANIDLQKAQNAGLLKQAQVEAKKTDITRDRLRKELALELANIETLQSLPSPTDPEKVEEHQKRIRDGKLKTAQITQSIAENEYKRQQDIRQAAEKAIEEQVKGAENAANAIEQLGKIASNALDRQTKILEAQKSLRASIVGLHDEEFRILIETETNERDKAALQEKAAKFRLDSLRQSQELEEKILEIQLAQERVQNRVAILKAQAAVAKAEAEKGKVDANPESTDADRQAADLGLEASRIELGATVETARLQEGLAAFRRQQTQVDNRRELLGARFDYAKSIVDPGDRSDAIERVQATAARGLRERNQDTPRFVLPTPVDLRSGLGAQGLQLNGLSDELRQLRQLTQSGVAANLVALVSATERTNTYLSTMAERRPVTIQRNNTTINNTAGRNNGGLPL